MNLKRSLFACVIFGGGFSAQTWACKPCGDALKYSIHNNSLVFTGTTVFVGEPPSDVVRTNSKNESMYKHQRYCIDVHVKVNKIFHTRDDDRISKGEIYKTQSCYIPPCKGISLPKVGESSLFFPENFGNCSSFSFENTDGNRERFLPLLRSKYPQQTAKHNANKNYKKSLKTPAVFNISTLVKHHRKGLIFETVAYVTFQSKCAQCPDNVICSPCMKPYIIISEKATKDKNLSNMTSYDMLLKIDKPDSLKNLNKYKFKIKYKDVQFSEKNNTIYSGDLISFEDIEN